MADRCRPVAVTGDDGEEITVSVLGAEPMDEESVAALGEVVRAAQRRFRAERPDRVADVPTGGPQISDTCAVPDPGEAGGGR